MQISVDQPAQWRLEAQTRRIVILDDDPSARAVAAELLRDAGYTVRTAATVTEFCRIIVDFEPDLVLVDNWVPDMDGNEMCSLLKLTLPDIPVVLWSTLCDEATLAMVARSCGADGAIEKRPGFANLVRGLYRFDRAYW